MKIEKIKFKEEEAQGVYKSYLKRIEKAVKTLPKSEQQEVLMEMNSHIFEAMQQNSKQNEMDCLLDVIDKLGVPEEVLKPLIADKKLEQATKTFNPLHVFKALILNITNGISYVIFFILYLCLSVFVFAIGAKLLYPNEVGMFYKPNEIFVLGVRAAENSTHKNYEVLGAWFIPAMLLGIIVFYFIITLLLKLKRFINKK